MGVSFKISKVGTRFRPKPAPAEKPAAAAISDGRLDSDDLSGPPLSSSKRKRESNVIQSGDNVLGSCYDKDDSSLLGQEVSFTLDLFPDGFSIGKAAESDNLEPSLREVPKSLHPYNRSSEALFSAIEMGRLPGDILDDIPSNYFNGSILCEVRDYRERIPESEDVRVVDGGLPVRHKLCLRMSLENIVKDIPSISNDSWTYGDLMEVESRILKATQPRLFLDPTPMLDKISETPVCNKLDLGICQARKKRLKLLGAVIVTPNNKTHGKKISIDRTCEGVNGKFSEIGHVTGDRSLHAHDHLAAQQSLMSNNFVPDARASTSFAGQSRFQSSIGYPKSYQDRVSGLPSTAVITNASNGVASSQDMINPYVNSTRNIQGIRDNLDIQMAQMASMKRSNQTGLDGLSQQSSVSTLDGIHGVDSTGKTTMMQHQIDMRGIQYSNVGGQKYPLGDARQSIAEDSSIQEGMTSFYSDQRIFRQGVKEERMELEPMKSEADRSRDDSLNMVTELSQMNQFHRQAQQAFVRSHFPNQSPWNNVGPLLEKDHRKDEQLQKRRSVHSPRVSGAAVIQPPISKSGDNSSGSMGHHGGPVSTAQGSQKDKMAAISGGAGGIASVVSSPNDSVQRQHQPPGSGKRKPSSASKNPSMGGVASPASVSNVNVPLNANSPSVGTSPMADQVLMERFLKIDSIMRLQLNSKKNKVDECPIPPHRKLSQDVSIHLSNALNDEDVIEKSSPFVMSKSLIGGSLNTCKSRTIDFMLAEHVSQGNGVSIVVSKFRDKITLMERSRDGMVALVPGEIDENGSVPHLDLLPAFSNTYYADLFGAQLCSLMVKEGYQIMDDRIRAAPTLLSNTSLGSYNAVGTSSDIIPSESQYSENVSGQLAGASLANNGLVSMTAPQNVMSNPPLLPPGSVQNVQMSHGFFPAGGMPARPSPLEPNALPPQSGQHIQQNQQHQMQKSLLMQNSSLSHLGVIGQAGNISMSNPMVNKTSLQLRLFQQQQQQAQSQMPRKMMMGLQGAVGMGSLGNNNVGLSGLNSVMGIGGIRGIGPGISAPMGLPSGISAPMGISSLPGVSSMGQNPINISQNSSISNVLSQHMRSGSFTPAHAAALKLMHSKGGNTLGGQAGIAGMSVNSPMHSNSPLSMLGQNLNRGNVNPMQRAAMATMGPPKFPGINVYMNQQQQAQLQQHQHFQQLHQQQLLQQQQQQQQQHHQQQQQTGSPLHNQQTMVSSPQVGSPAMSIQQQLSQPQQIGSPALSQQNPMSPQLSAGALQQMNNVGNAAPPASPQLSSQTLGSVGSISSSPMELQVVNKGSSINNI